MLFLSDEMTSINICFFIIKIIDFFVLNSLKFTIVGLWEQNDKEIDTSSVPLSSGNGCATVPVPVIQDTWNQEVDLETNMYSSLVTRLDKVIDF